MSNLDNIIQTILQDSETESKNILDDAKAKKDKYISEMERDANARKEEIIAKGNDEAEQLIEKIVNNANLKSRDSILESKQEVISKILDIVKEKLSKIDDKSYIDILVNSIKKYDIKENVEIIVQEDKLESVKALGLKNKISDNYTNSGFSFIEENSIINNDFSSLVDYMKDDLEAYIAEELFAK